VLYRAKQRMRELIDRQEGLKAFLFEGWMTEWAIRSKRVDRYVR
jgi:hypothetical protein